MAGVKGMASPEQVKPVSPELNIQVPEGMKFQAPSDSYVESSSAARPSLDEIFAKASKRLSLDEIASQTSIGGESDFTSETLSLGEQIVDIPARAKASLQVTDKELQQSLEQSYGKENVRRNGDKIEFKRGDKWREFDAGFEPVGDVVDATRMLVEEVPAMAATALAAIPAIAATVGTGGAYAPMGVAQVAAARAAGAVGGQAVADWLQGLTGVERDKDRSALMEYGTTAILSPLFGAMGDHVAKNILKKTAAKSAELMPAKELFKEEISNISESMAFLKEKGFLENIPGTDTPLILSQLNPSNRAAMDITKKASANKQFSQFLELQAQGVDKGIQAFAKQLGDFAGNTKGLGQKFKDSVQASIKKEGVAIGEARQLLVDNAGDKSLPIPALKAKVEEFAKSIGFNIGADNDLSSIKNYLVDRQGYSKQAANLIAEKTNEMLRKTINGKMSADELVGAYREINGVYSNLAKRGSISVDPLFRGKVGEIRRFFADELIDKVEVIGSPEDKLKYTANLKKFSELVTARDEFHAEFKNDKVATHILSKAIFDKGKDGLDTLAAAKVLTQDAPEILESAKGQFLQSVRAKSFNAATKKTDWGKFVKEVNSLGGEMLESAFGKDAETTLKHFAVLGDALESGKSEFKTPPEIAGIVKRMALGLTSRFVAGNAAVDLISQLDTERALAKAISREGIDKFLATVPKERKSAFKIMLDSYHKAALSSALSADAAVRNYQRGVRETKE